MKRRNFLGMLAGLGAGFGVWKRRTLEYAVNTTSVAQVAGTGRVEFEALASPSQAWMFRVPYCGCGYQMSHLDWPHPPQWQDGWRTVRCERCDVTTQLRLWLPLGVRI